MYSSDENLCIKWNDFKESITSALGERREDKEFADVTLVCEDGQQVEAHKVILASASPFFLNLLRRNKHPHPLIYMRGMKSEDLTAIVDFLYYGETRVDHENLESFLAVAEELKLEGLTGNKEVEEDVNFLKLQAIVKTDPETISSLLIKKTEADMNQEHSNRSCSKVDYPEPIDMQDVRKQIKSMMEMGDSFNDGKQKKRSRRCKVCKKEDTYSHIYKHIDANHMSVPYPCDVCGKVSRSKNGLRVHKRKYHK